jgi:hypothetical protein
VIRPEHGEVMLFEYGIALPPGPMAAAKQWEPAGSSASY